MNYSLSTIRKKANEAGYSFQKGYQRWIHQGWGYVQTNNGERIIGYQIYDFTNKCLVHGTYTDLYDHALDFDEAVSVLANLCNERGVKF